MILYNKNYNGKFQSWSIVKTDHDCLITFGELNGAKQIKNAPLKEYDSRIRKKKLEGYLEITKGVTQLLQDRELSTNEVIYILNNHDWTSSDYSILPMKCVPFKERKLKYPVIGQPKFNGVRSVMRVEQVIEGIGMFATTSTKVVLRSKEGLEYVLPHITNSISPEQLGDNVLDGELYIHGKKLNYIKASIPIRNQFGTVSVSTNEPTAVHFYVFDLAMPNLDQESRLNLSMGYTSTHVHTVPNLFIKDDKEATVFRNLFIKEGYEGIVLRSMYEEYAFGSRPNFIMKYKQVQDAEFVVIDIVRAADDGSGNGCKFICQNDTNNETFEAMPAGFSKEEQEEYLINKEDYIGKKATIKYYERSGVKDVPFHCNFVTFRNGTN